MRTLRVNPTAGNNVGHPEYQSPPQEILQRREK